MSRRTNFITDIIDADLAAGRHTSVVTRFPPEPNGYLHIGHAKSICLNFGLAQQYNGRCHLRYDDTNPVTEETEYVDSIAADVRWLGFDWGEHRYFASDYFEQMYGYAVELIQKGLAYVDHQTLDEIRENRGTVTEPGTPSRYRDRSVEENLELFAQMRAGAFEDGACVLRAKIDMGASNMLMRDPIIYRIKHADHHRTGDTWCIYPMYDFAHCLEDAIEHITHSLCTLEFENNRELYDWVIDNTSVPSRPRQTEFARLNLEYTLMSKRKLLTLVQDGVVEGWDDPRLPTIAGLRRRGFTPASIRAFAEMIGIARNDNRVDIGKLEFCIRDDLNHKSPRIMAVLKPLKVTITTLAADDEQWVDGDVWPHDIPKDGSRKIPITREIYIERDDFAEEPPKGWRRLAPGDEVRLRHAFIIRCDEVIRDANGEVVELRCSHDPATLNAEPADGRKIRGVIHWVSATKGVKREVRLYDRLFSVADPEADPEVPFTEHLNPESLVVVQAVVEPAFADAAAGSHFQFERLGYFYVDPETSSEGAPVFNRVVTLRDAWARAHDADKPASRESRRGERKRSRGDASPAKDRAAERERQLAADPALQDRYLTLRSYDVGEEDAFVLSGDAGALRLFENVRASGAPAVAAARWIVNELPRARRAQEGEDKLTPSSLAELVSLVEDGRMTATAAREVLVALLEKGGSAEALMQEMGLERVDDDGALNALIEQVLAAHPDEVARYKEGRHNLIGFFVGRVMQQSGGSADAARVRELLQARLSA